MSDIASPESASETPETVTVPVAVYEELESTIVALAGLVSEVHDHAVATMDEELHRLSHEMVERVDAEHPVVEQLMRRETAKQLGLDPAISREDLQKELEARSNPIAALAQALGLDPSQMQVIDVSGGDDEGFDPFEG